MDPAPARTRPDGLRILRNGLVAALVAVAVFALLGFLIVPVVARSKLEALGTRELGRPVTIGRLEFNPFTLHARLSDFALADREPQRTLARFDALDLDFSIASLWKRAAVFDAVRLAHPQVELTRNADGRYNIQDLIDRFVRAPEGPPTLFSINNIEVDGGSIALDDRPHARKIVVSKLGIGIPFLSSFPYDAQIHVTPRFEGAVDGAAFGLTGNVTAPFEDTKDATLELNLDALSLPRYAEYVSLPQRLEVRDGALTTRLKLVFATEKGVARSVALSGTARIDRLALVRPDGSSLATAAAVDVSLASLDALARAVVLDRVAIEAPDIDLRRGAEGALEMASVAGNSRAAAAPPWSYSIRDAHVGNGKVRVTDNAVSPAFATVLSSVVIDAKRIASKGAPGTVELRFATDEGAQFAAQGEADIANASAHGRFEVKNMRVGTLRPYYAPAVHAEVRRGALDYASDFEVAPDGDSARMTLHNGAATFADVEAVLPGEREPALRIAHAELAGVALDTAKRTFAIDSVAGRQGSLRVMRERDGALNIEQLTRPSKALETAERRISANAVSAPPWSVLMRTVKFDGLGVDFEDRVPASPVKLRVADGRFSIQNVGNAPAASMAFEGTARARPAGRMTLKGTVVAEPLKVDCRIDASGIDLVPLRPYYEPTTNIIVTGGAVATKGRLTYAAAGAGRAHARYTGDVTISNFGSLDRPTSQDLVRWKTLTLTGVDAVSEPFSLALGAVAADGFYARIILNADATLNLQQLLAPHSAAAQAAAPGPSTMVSGVTTKTLPGDAGGPLPVSIGRIQLSDGEVQYADFFVTPNYTAHLTSVTGGVSALSQAQAGTVEVAARVEGTAPVAINGTINPFAQRLALDLTGKATDIDLPPLTPYSVKYAGYGIQKGKLSLEVHYRVDDRKLAATNKLKLDQLAFGERVESPTATKLPVLLAVSLLKDRNGVINLDLPIQGTLDDPQFSVWGVLVQIFVNLITKAITAPFALLGSLGGGGGEQLAYIEFAPGHAELSASAHDKLATLAKALNDRPGLKIDAAGRAIPDVDRAGLKRAMLDQALRAEKLKSVAAAGTSASADDAAKIDAAEYPKLLASVYKDADLKDKPRNAIGIAKSIPAAEMESLLLASYRVDDAALTALANRRAQMVKEWFVSEGGIPAERVYIVAPKVSGDGLKDEGAPTRVDFAIR
jgi:uncharacterized protein involved in outer membrane biogenesis